MAQLSGQNFAVTTQPTGFPTPAPVAQADLGYLAEVDQLIVQQQIEMLEVLTGFEMENKYTVYNSQGQPVFYVVEETSCCMRECCGPWRAFDMRVMNSQQREVLHLSRPLRCEWFSGCCCCCLQQLEVSAGGRQLGLITQDWTLVKPQFSVRRPDGTTALKIKGPLCPCSCGPRAVDFRVTSEDGQHELGKITKKWSGFAQEFFTDADMFGVTFPMDLEVEMKGTLFGALFLIDFMYFETAF